MYRQPSDDGAVTAVIAAGHQRRRLGQLGDRGRHGGQVDIVYESVNLLVCLMVTPVPSIAP